MTPNKPLNFTPAAAQPPSDARSARAGQLNRYVFASTMTRTSIRKISIQGEEFRWCIRGNTLSSNTSLITIFKEGIPSRPLYVDPYPWDLEIGPRAVRTAVEFALQRGWLSDESNLPMYLGYKNGSFLMLRNGIKYTHDHNT